MIYCDVCEQPLDDEKPWQPGLGGGGAHFECLETTTDEGDDDD